MAKRKAGSLSELRKAAVDTLFAHVKEHPDIRAELPALRTALDNGTEHPREEFAEWCTERALAGDTGAARLLLAMCSLLLVRGGPLPPSLECYLGLALAQLAVGDQKVAGNALHLRELRKGGNRTAGSLDRELRIAAEARKAHDKLGRWRESRDGPGACEVVVERMALDISAGRVDAIRKKWGSAVDGLEEHDLLDTPQPFQWLYWRLLAEQQDLRRMFGEEVIE